MMDTFEKWIMVQYIEDFEKHLRDEGRVDKNFLVMKTVDFKKIVIDEIERTKTEY